jgi:hypothetical protein
MPLSLNQLLLGASRSGDLALAGERIDKGADPNYHDTRYGSAAAAAARRGNLAMLRLLLDRGLTPTGPAAISGAGLIEIALYHGQEHAALLLADRGFRLLPHALPHFRNALLAAFERRGRGVIDAGPSCGTA